MGQKWSKIDFYNFGPKPDSDGRKPTWGPLGGLHTPSEGPTYPQVPSNTLRIGAKSTSRGVKIGRKSSKMTAEQANLRFLATTSCQTAPG